MMSKDFSPENHSLNPADFTNIRFSPQPFRSFEATAGLATIYSKLDIQPPVTPYQPSEQLPEILQQLHSFQPLCSSGSQRELARKALTTLKNRKPEDIRNLAKSLADDVASAVD